MKKATRRQIELLSRLMSQTDPDKLTRIFSQEGLSETQSLKDLTVYQASRLIRKLLGGKRWGSF